MKQIYLAFIAFFVTFLNAQAGSPLVARIGDTGYNSLQAALAAAENNETIELVADVDLGEDYLTFNRSTECYVTLDLGTYTITSAVSDEYATLFMEGPDAQLSITGSGKIVNTNKGGGAVYVATGELYIEGGSFENSLTSPLGVVEVYAGYLEINGGQFLGGSLMVDLGEEAAAKIYGGVFSLEPETKLLGDGCDVLDNEHPVTKATYPYEVVQFYYGIGEAWYEDFADVKDDIKNNGTVTLLTNVELGAYSLEFDIENLTWTFDLNGKTITSSGDYTIAVSNSGEEGGLTIKGPGVIGNTNEYGGNAALADESGALFVDGGTLTNGNMDYPLIYVAGGYVEINGGAFLSKKLFGEETGLVNNISLWGGIYSMTIDSKYLGKGSTIVSNDDAKTMGVYPYKVYNANVTAIKRMLAAPQQQSKVIKTIENGRIVIIKDGAKYDLSGRKL